MRFCSYCGAHIEDEAVVCIKCGRAVECPTKPKVNNTNDTLDILIKIFMILGCISSGWLLIPLAWTIPMTVSAFKSIDNKLPIGTGFKVCTLIFVSFVSGVLLLCRNESA